MSTYRRSGHWRRGRSGDRHWVRDHAVSRDSWSNRDGYGAAHKYANSRAQRRKVKSLEVV